MVSEERSLEEDLEVRDAEKTMCILSCLELAPEIASPPLLGEGECAKACIDACYDIYGATESDYVVAYVQRMRGDPFSSSTEEVVLHVLTGDFRGYVKKNKRNLRVANIKGGRREVFRYRGDAVRKLRKALESLGILDALGACALVYLFERRWTEDGEPIFIPVAVIFPFRG